jgi:hypothetical protein
MRDTELMNQLVTQTWNLYHQSTLGNKLEVKNLAREVMDTINLNPNPATEIFKIPGKEIYDAAQNLEIITPKANRLYQLALQQQLKLENKVSDTEPHQIVSANGPVMEGSLYQLAGKYLKLPPPPPAEEPEVLAPVVKRVRAMGSLGEIGSLSWAILLLLTGAAGATVFLYFTKKRA